MFVPLLILYVYVCLWSIVGIGIRGGYHVPISPNKPLAPGDTTYEFDFPPFHGSMLHLQEALLQVGGRLKRLRTADNTYGALTATIAKPAETTSKEAAPDPGEKIVLANNVLHTLFKDITVHIGNNQVLNMFICKYR